MWKVAILDDFQGVALTSADWSSVRENAEITIFRDHVDAEDALVQRLHPFHAICVMRERTPLTARILRKLPNLRFIGSNASYNASIDLAAANNLGITVSGTGGRGNGAPELTWALILAAARHIPAEYASMRSGGWQVGVGTDLEGSTLGLLGLGKVGARVAAVGRAFGMNVIAWSQNLTREAADAAGVRMVDRDTLFRDSDWLSVHLVLSDRTKGIIGASELAKMKGSAWLVNTSRGPLVEERALIGALSRRSIGGAALDVFDTEPLPSEHPLRALDNVLLTPHLGFVTQQTYRVFYGETVENLLAWMKGSPLRTLT